MSQSSISIADLRIDYRLAALNEDMTGDQPMAFFRKWFDDAVHAKVMEVNAMTLATVDKQGSPHARIVLLKGVDERGFLFFTNYNSHKGQQIADCSNVALVFFWAELERQVRVEGMIEKLPSAESDAYFHSRPLGSRIGAWSSPQSQAVTGREALEVSYARYEAQFSHGEVPRPEHWGGYVVNPTMVEFWQGRSSRMHDRIRFTRGNIDTPDWQKHRLAP